MNKYHCTKCNKEKIIRSVQKEVSIACCDGSNPVKHVMGDAPKKHVPVKKPVEVPPPKIIQPTPEKLTKLDQPPGDIKLPETQKPSPPAKLP